MSLCYWNIDEGIGLEDILNAGVRLDQLTLWQFHGAVVGLVLSGGNQRAFFLACRLDSGEVQDSFRRPVYDMINYQNLARAAFGAHHDQFRDHLGVGGCGNIGRAIPRYVGLYHHGVSALDELLHSAQRIHRRTCHCSRVLAGDHGNILRVEHGNTSGRRTANRLLLTVAAAQEDRRAQSRYRTQELTSVEPFH